MQKSELKEALVGIEQTGHYWFALGQFMREKNIKIEKAEEPKLSISLAMLILSISMTIDTLIDEIK